MAGLARSRHAVTLRAAVPRALALWLALAALLVAAEAARASVFVSDPQGVLRISPGYKFTPGGLSHALRVAANLPADPARLGEVSRAKFSSYTPCLAVVQARDVRWLESAPEFVRYEAEKGMGGFRPGALRRLIAEAWERGMYATGASGGEAGGAMEGSGDGARNLAEPGFEEPAASFPQRGLKAGPSWATLTHVGRPTRSLIPASAQPFCTQENTVIFAVEGTPADVHRTKQIATWTVLLVVASFCVAAGLMLAQNDEQPEDAEDEFSGLLYNAADMKLAEEAFLDDEPWEDGGEDY